MPKLVTPLTDNQCRSAQPPEKGIKTLSDGAGLRLEINVQGQKYWRFRYYRPFDGKREVLAFGVYPEVSLKEARNKREEARNLLTQGIDPKQQNIVKQKKLNKSRYTFENVAREWHADRVQQADKWGDGHAHRVLRSLEIHVFPKLGNFPVNEILPLDILPILKAIEHEGKRDTTHKVFDVVNQVFSYAVRLGLCQFNPASELRRELAAVKQTHFAHILDKNEIGKLLRAIDSYTGLPQVCVLLKISPYIFSRPSEIRLMKWSEIDFDKALWYKSGENMKNGLDHIVPLSKQVLELIHSLKPITGHYEYVFFNKSKKQALSDGTATRALHRLGYKGIATMHGFRHMASTHLNEKEYNRDWIEAQLAHKDSNTTRAVYNQAQYLSQRQKMMQEWADFLDTLKNNKT